MVRRPLRLTRGELWTAVAWLVILGAAAVGLWLAVGNGLPEDGTLTGTAAAAGGGRQLPRCRGGGRRMPSWRADSGRGPFVPRQDGFLEPTRRLGRPGWLSAGTVDGRPVGAARSRCLAIIPIVVYVISYAPWVALGNQFWTGFPAGHTGQTLADLTVSMYRYHDELRGEARRLVAVVGMAA